ncbi:MAG TPA: hypothetical protein ENK82_03345 [Campylobacterales bacterium]|nr:hypothetical protein [Campylobacterales bacterium]HHS92356.1 hypothetical protein [Campylobacterales bacterium]
MIRLLLLLAVLLHGVEASSQKYFIKFGSFKNLQGLEKSINKLPSGLRSHVVIVRNRAWYIPFAYYTSNKQALSSKVRLYKRYFPDAHIASSRVMLNYPLIRNYATKKESRVIPKRQYVAPVTTYKAPIPAPMTTPSYAPKPSYQNIAISEEDNIILLPPKTVQPQQSVSYQQPITQKVVINQVEEEDTFRQNQPKRYKRFSKQMLSGNHYYLAYKQNGNNPDLLIKVTFGNHEVTYQPVIGDMQMTQASYLIEGDRLYMFTDAFTREGAFSKLEEHRDDHFLVSSWMNGKKLNTLRYYYKLNDAKRYLGLNASDGLAEILSEGDYDDFFTDE